MQAAHPIPTADRLMILGLDGATWSVLDPMRQRGVMPNLDALLARSAHGILRSTVPPMTAAAWATVQTGCDPARHGIFDHRYYDAGSGLMKVNHSGRYRVKSLWHLLDEAGRTSISLNLPGTYPAPAVKGVIVSGMDCPHLEAALSSAPPEFRARLAAEAPNYHLKYSWKRVPASLDEMRANARGTVEEFSGRAQGARLADQVAPDWAVLLVQFQNLDPFQHRAWRYLNVDQTGLELAGFNEQAAGVMRGLDQALGELCELADRRGAAILIVSDHGFGPCLGRVHVNRILEDAGLVRKPGLAGRIQRRAVQGLEHLRLWSEKRNDPAARGASFSASVRANFPLDWRRTSAFAPHQDTAAMVYLNRASVCPEAPLRTPRQLDDALTAASQALAEARHPDTGNPLFPEIVPMAQRYGLDPAELGYPDLIALPDEPYWVRSKLAPGRVWVEPDENLPGTHRRDGVISLSAPGITPGRHLQANLRDVTPSALALLGLAVPDWVEGKPLPFLAGSSPGLRRDDPKPPIGPHATAGFEFSAEEQALIEKRLADLGYLA